MAIVEKKYLVHDSIKTFLAQIKSQKTNITQFYTKIGMCREVRYRQQSKSFSKTIRTGREVKENEVDEEISKKKFLKSKSQKIGKLLRKDHQDFLYEGVAFSLVRYKKQLKDLLLLEISFHSIEEAEAFVLPEALKTYIIKDVSHYDRYRNKNLALLGNPQKNPYNIYALFKDIEQGRFKGVSQVIFPEMGVSDSARIIVYELFQTLKNDRDLLLKENDIHALERFRKNIYTLKTILDAYRHIFDKTLFKKVSLHLSIIEKNISTNRDLLLIRTNLTLLESGFSEKEVNSFISRIDTRIEKEKHKVKSYFKTREFSIMFAQLDLLVKEQSNIYTTHYANTAIGPVIKKSVYKRLKDFLQLSEKYAMCHDLDSYEEMQHALFKTTIILEKFAHLYHHEAYTQMRTLLQTIDTNITKFIDLHKHALIMKTYINHSQKEASEKEALLENIKESRMKLENTLNHDIDEAIFLLRKNRNIFSPKRDKKS